MPTFPANIKPVVNQGYTLGASDNVIRTPVQGGAPLQMLDYRTGPVAFDVVIIGDRLKFQAWTDFYYGQIDAGASKFTMELDSGNGLEEHAVQILTDTVSEDGSQDPIWKISYTLLADTTPAQEAPFQGNLADLYAIYGDDTQAILDALAQFVLVDLPAIF